MGVTTGTRLGSYLASEPGVPRMLFETSFSADALGNPNYDVSADGERFVMIQPPRSLDGRYHVEIVRGERGLKAEHYTRQVRMS